MLRIVRCTTELGRAPAVDRYFGQQAARLRMLDGNADAFVGHRTEADVVRYALVTAWHGFGALQAAIGGDVVRARLLDALADDVREVEVEHLERMDLPPIGAGGEATLLRVYGGTIAHRQAETFYAFTRDRTWPEVGRADALVTAHVGRRMASDVDHVALVTAWRSWDDLLVAFPHAASRPLVLPEDEALVADLGVEHFELVPVNPGG